MPPIDQNRQPRPALVFYLQYHNLGLVYYGWFP